MPISPEEKNAFDKVLRAHLALFPSTRITWAVSAASPTTSTLSPTPSLFAPSPSAALNPRSRKLRVKFLNSCGSKLFGLRCPPGRPLSF
jgi:hypothetical protein